MLTKMTIATALALTLLAGAAHAAGHGGTVSPPALRADAALIHRAAAGDDARKGWLQRWQDKKRQEQANAEAARRWREDRQRDKIQNQELTRKLRIERERQAEERRLKEEQRRIIRQGCKYGRGGSC